MTFYILEPSYEVKIIAMLSYEESTLRCDWIEGKILDDVPDNLTVKMENTPTKLPDFFNVSDAPIVSNDFVKALKSSGADNFEVFPVSITINNKLVNELNYFVLNVIGLISGLDREKSNVTLFDDPEDYNVGRINDMVLKSDVIHDFLLFRLEEYSDVIIISGAVRNKINSLSGVRIVPAEGWSDTHRF